jgi:hypothetical protein
MAITVGKTGMPQQVHRNNLHILDVCVVGQCLRLTTGCSFVCENVSPDTDLNGACGKSASKVLMLCRAAEPAAAEGSKHLVLGQQ